MLYRKIEKEIRDYCLNKPNKVLVVDGARQVGKSFIIRHVGQQMFDNYIEINLLEAADGMRFFESVKTTEDFYFRLSSVAKGRLGNKENTLVFLEEIQAYPHVFTMLKFLKAEDRFTYIASGSLLGVALAKSVSIPIGSIQVRHMYPLDFEEFLIANGIGQDVIGYLRKQFEQELPLDEGFHSKILDLFKKYLLVGGLPDVVNTYLATTDIVEVRRVQLEVHDYYGADASQYDVANKLKIKNVYDSVPSNLENKRKRVFANRIENKKGKRFDDYLEAFDYLVNAGIALQVKAVSQPKFPLLESMQKNLLKLYLNDVGVLTGLLYGRNVVAVLDDIRSINLGSVYESVVAQELHAHGHRLFYYDSKKHGEVDFLVESDMLLSVVPIEVKSGKDYTVHSALTTFVETKDYSVKKAYVLSNDRNVFTEDGITYLPVYYVMFF